jgi:hypothetical protein
MLWRRGEMAWSSRRVPMRIGPLVALSVLLQLVCVWDASELVVAVGMVQHGPHISNLNVLLPPRSSRPVHYHLQGYNGCFTWFVCLSPATIFLCCILLAVFAIPLKLWFPLVEWSVSFCLADSPYLCKKLSSLVKMIHEASSH